jgi:hypothetical protein
LLYNLKKLKWDLQLSVHSHSLQQALLLSAKRRLQPKFPLRGEWIKKMCYVHTMEYYPVF